MGLQEAAGAELQDDGRLAHCASSEKIRSMPTHFSPGAAWGRAFWKTVHRRFPSGIDRRQFAGDRAGKVVGDLGDHEQPVAGAPDFHRQEPLGPDRLGHFGPGRTGGVRLFIVGDQVGIRDQIQGETQASGQFGLLSPRRLGRSWAPSLLGVVLAFPIFTINGIYESEVAYRIEGGVAMKALVCVQPHDIRVEDRPAPVRRDGEVLIRMRRAGICGTDYHIYGGKHPFLEYPG